MSVYEPTAVSGVIAPCKGAFRNCKAISSLRGSRQIRLQAAALGSMQSRNTQSTKRSFVRWVYFALKRRGLVKKSILSAKIKSHIPSQRYMASIKLITIFNWLQIVPYPAPLFSFKIAATIPSLNDAIMLPFINVFVAFCYHSPQKLKSSRSLISGSI